MEVTRETIIGTLLEYDMSVAPLLLASGMHCLGCALSHGESLGEACAVHGIDVDILVDEINEFLENKEALSI